VLSGRQATFSQVRRARSSCQPAMRERFLMVVSAAGNYFTMFERRADYSA